MAITGVIVALGVGSIFQVAAVPHDVEELYNAAHARLLQLEHADKWVTLQYRGHCGGCTHHALLAAGLFSVIGPSLFAWKLIPVLFLGLLAYFGSSLLLRYSGAPSAWAFGLLLIFVPPTFLELSMTAWGNHFESGVAAVVCLSTALGFRDVPSVRRATLVGFTLAWALWIGFSSAFVPVGVAWILRRHLWTRHGAVALAAMSSVGLIWMAQALQSPSTVFDTIYQSGESIPNPARIPSKIWSLIGPRQLVALFGWKTGPWGWVAGWFVVVAAIRAGWLFRSHAVARAAGTLLIAYLAIYSVVRFTVWAPPAPEIAPPGSMRYAAPIYGLFFLIFAGGIGEAWRRGRRTLAIAMLIPSLAVGAAARISVLMSAPTSAAAVFSMAAPDFEYARDQLAYLFSSQEHAACETTAIDAQSFHAFGYGWSETRQLLDAHPDAPIVPPTSSHPAALEGVASALLSHLDGSDSADVELVHELLVRSAHLEVDVQRGLIAATGYRRVWTDTTVDHGPLALKNWTRRIESLPPTAQQGLTIAFGRKWAHATIGWRTTEAVVLPDPTALAEPLQPFFWEGYAEGLGERIGPAAQSIQAPMALDSWRRAVSDGIRRRWISQSR